MADERRLTAQRADGATLLIFYMVALLVVPARFTIAFVPITLPPALFVAMCLAVVWFAAHLVDHLGMAKGRNAVRTVLAIYVMLHLMTYALATRRYLPIDELSVSDSALIRVVSMAALAVFIVDAVRSGERLSRALRVMVACLTVSAFVGLFQFGLGLDLASYITLPGLRVQDNGYSALESRSIFFRPAGTVNHPIEFGLVCVLGVPFAAHFVFQAKDKGEPAGRWWMALSLLALMAILSLSRTAIIGLVVTGVVMAILLPRERGLPLLGVGAVFLGGASVVVPGLFGTVTSMFSNIEDDPSFQGRTKDYDGAWLEIAKHPWLGRGFGTFLPSKYTILDNQYLLTMIENGYLGLIAFVLLFLAGIFAALRARALSKDEGVRGIAMCLVAAMLTSALGAATFDELAFSVATGMTFMLIGVSGTLLRIARQEAAERKAAEVSSAS
ncbi:O-antigen ligase family protein [Lentzea sp. BCCO 10_0061]|uniref:O-antigen ligase family protein n=1 Tax=Lentzea sokolovensis TaxID=3095429 RepID=A0ABU4UNL2_9PSEU|nr:O-antigen ligase family protein [Lentzea sp. BCCO 10_0061]MDX8141009.1 O-antigen ligase family protein [Lentzea sp. BCCO 10_0061]